MDIIHRKAGAGDAGLGKGGGAAAAVWKKIQGKAIIINALLNITVECDCLSGKHPIISPDYGFIGGYHPGEVDAESLKMTGPDIFEKAHPGIPWQRQFSYAREIGFMSPVNKVYASPL